MKVGKIYNHKKNFSIVGGGEKKIKVTRRAAAAMNTQSLRIALPTTTNFFSVFTYFSDGEKYHSLVENVVLCRGSLPSFRIKFSSNPFYFFEGEKFE